MSKGRVSKFTPEQIDLIIRTYRATLSQSETARLLIKHFKLDISPGLVSYYVTEYATFEKSSRPYKTREKNDTRKLATKK
jgi:hypothetical protein